MKDIVCVRCQELIEDIRRARRFIHTTPNLDPWYLFLHEECFQKAPEKEILPQQSFTKLVVSLHLAEGHKLEELMERPFLRFPTARK